MKAYIAMNMIKEIKTDSGVIVKLEIKNKVLGVFVAFKTKKAAKERFGKDIRMVEVKLEGAVKDL